MNPSPSFHRPVISIISETFINTRQRNARKYRGDIPHQLFLTFTVCYGAFIFGSILSWGGPALKHLDELEYVHRSPGKDFAWITSSGPLAIACGMCLWEFLVRRMGPKKTLLLHSPISLFSWFLMAYFNTYKIYWTAHFISSFCAACYIYAGESFLIATVHRKNMKTFYALFRTSVIFGFLAMNIINAFLSRLWLCVVSASLTSFAVMLTVFLPDSPTYLVQKSELEAEKSLKYYTGKQTVGPELNVVRQHVKYLHFGSITNKHMLQSKVIIKSICLIVLLQIFRVGTGYYTFILDSTRMFLFNRALFNPYIDNIIFAFVLSFTNFVACMGHLHGNFGVKKPLMISFFSCGVVLGLLGTVNYLNIQINILSINGITLIILCLFAITYDIGLNICTDILLYEYMPHQIYDFLKKLMVMIQWFLVFIVQRLYKEGHINNSVHIAVWIMSSLAFLGFCFVAMFIVDTKDKSLMHIQMELGGNPIGSRGSPRQRLCTPFEHLNEMKYLQNLITNDMMQHNDTEH